MSELVSRLTDLNPFSSKTRAEREVDDEDKGEEIDDHTVAGGGHGGRSSEITKTQLRISHALRCLIASKDILTEAEAGLANQTMTPALRQLLDRPHIHVPPELTDRSRPLPEYFVSSSHNTYLVAHQLYGTSCATAYRTALRTGSRCVEIDAWDNGDDRDEPKVTHGYTLVSNIPFRLVCETIRDVVDEEAAQVRRLPAGPDAAEREDESYRPAPILLSLENHCDAAGQLRLVEIMREVFGHRLLDKPVRDKGHAEQEGSGEHVRLEELGSKIAVIVECHLSEEADLSDDDDDDSSSSCDEAERKDREQYKAEAKATRDTIIIPELAELGVYAQSVKPANDAWFNDTAQARDQTQPLALPHHHLINISESGLSRHLPEAAGKIAAHNAQHLMRVYPKGTRISSRNMKVIPFWAVGAQICAMNWQTFGANMQMNEALFAGTDGYVLKPEALRSGGGSGTTKPRRRRLRLHVAGASDIPLPAGREPDEIKPYLTCTLAYGGTSLKEVKRKTSPYKQHKIGFLHRGENPPPTDPVWDEELVWEEFEDDELVFLRLYIKSDDSFARNPILTVAPIRLLYAVDGWTFIRMLDLKGHETRCALLVRFEIEDL
ncbi:hypothetical protein MCOR25_008985 [Pyricularia grisea]|nr:hypothetical protein MCOR25_008985 [Pyricularia grisea]